jgi:hypothetical protein
MKSMGKKLEFNNNVRIGLEIYSYDLETNHKTNSLILTSYCIIHLSIQKSKQIKNHIVSSILERE